MVANIIMVIETVLVREVRVAIMLAMIIDIIVKKALENLYRMNIMKVFLITVSIIAEDFRGMVGCPITVIKISYIAVVFLIMVARLIMEVSHIVVVFHITVVSHILVVFLIMVVSHITVVSHILVVFLIMADSHIMVVFLIMADSPIKVVSHIMVDYLTAPAIWRTCAIRAIFFVHQIPARDRNINGDTQEAVPDQIHAVECHQFLHVSYTATANHNVVQNSNIVDLTH